MMQKLTLSHEISKVIFSKLTSIVSLSVAGNDRLLMKSMIGNLHQWLSDVDDSFLKDFEEKVSSISFNRVGSRLKSELETATNAKLSLDSLSYHK